MNRQKGFSAVIVLLSLLLLVAVGFTGYYVWNNQSNNDSANNTEKQEPAASDNLQEYITIDSLGIKIQKNNDSAKFTFENNNGSIVVKSDTLAKNMDEVCMENHGGNGVLAVISKDKKPIPSDSEYLVGKKIVKEFNDYVIVVSRTPGGGNGWVCGSSGSESLPASLQATINDLDNKLDLLISSSLRM